MTDYKINAGGFYNSALLLLAIYLLLGPIFCGVAALILLVISIWSMRQ